MKNRFFTSICLLIFSLPALAQKDTARHRFAQTYFGAGAHFMLGGTTQYTDSMGQTHTRNLPTSFQPKLVIGGLHFWKRVDFYVAFSLPTAKFNAEDSNSYRYTAGIETGARYYPLRMNSRTVSPYLGMNWGIVSYAQQVPGMPEGTHISRNVLNLETGLAFRTGGFILEFNFAYMATHSFTYALSRNTKGTTNFSPFSVGISLKYALDFTASSGGKEARRFNQQLDSTLTVKKWNNVFHIGVGPSAAFGLGHNTYNAALRPWLDDPLPVVLCPDFSLGVQLEKPGIDISLSVRPMFFRQEGYNFQQQLDRVSVALEVFRFLFNYKGFVPYAGAFASYEYLHLAEKDHDQTVTDVTAHKPGWGFILGWDIRPNRNDWWVLRTNVRFTPYVPFKVNNRDYVVSQWEFNFIQFVLYPQRLVVTRELVRNKK